jgi:hypothetical protein
MTILRAIEGKTSAHSSRTYPRVWRKLKEPSLGRYKPPRIQRPAWVFLLVAGRAHLSILTVSHGLNIPYRTGSDAGWPPLFSGISAAQRDCARDDALHRNWGREREVRAGRRPSARVVPNVMANSILPAASVSCLFVAVKLGMLHLRVCSGVGEKLDK